MKRRSSRWLGRISPSRFGTRSSAGLPQFRNRFSVWTPCTFAQKCASSLTKVGSETVERGGLPRIVAMRRFYEGEKSFGLRIEQVEENLCETVAQFDRVSRFM